MVPGSTSICALSMDSEAEVGLSGSISVWVERVLKTGESGLARGSDDRPPHSKALGAFSKIVSRQIIPLPSPGPARKLFSRPSRKIGEGGIRTRGTLLGSTRFPVVHNRPLCHLSRFGTGFDCK